MSSVTARVRATLGIKGLLCIVFLLVSVVALIAYTSIVTITPTAQFAMGASSASWTIYVNDVDQLRYLPGTGSPSGSQQLGAPSDADLNTFAFKVVTDANRVCAVKIGLTSAVNVSRFSKFEITVMRWNSTASAWQAETLYAAPTGSSAKTFVNGLTAGDVGYVYHVASLSSYYLVKTTYSHDLSDATATITVTFSYTPLPQASF